MQAWQGGRMVGKHGPAVTRLIINPFSPHPWDYPDYPPNPIYAQIMVRVTLIVSRAIYITMVRPR